MKINYNKNVSKNFKSGFTLIELLVVVAVIAILSAIILAALGNARNKGSDGAIKADLANARVQAEVYYNTAGAGSYSSICGVAGVGGVGGLIFGASKSAGLAGAYTVNAAGAANTATCNQSANAWAAEVPLSTSGQYWCVDSTGISIREFGTSLFAANDYGCN